MSRDTIVHSCLTAMETAGMVSSQQYRCQLASCACCVFRYVKSDPISGIGILESRDWRHNTSMHAKIELGGIVIWILFPPILFRTAERGI